MIIPVSNSKQNIGYSILNEENFLIDYLKLQERLNVKLSSFFKQSINACSFNSFDESKMLYDSISPVYKMLGKSLSNIDAIHSLQKKLDAIDLSQPDFSKKVDNYNSTYIKVFDKIVKETTMLEHFIYDLPKEDNKTVETVESVVPTESFQEVIDMEETPPVEESVTPIVSEDSNANPAEISEVSNNNESEIGENTLLVSELENKVVLPYTIDTLKQLMLENPKKYKTLDDVIKDIYTKPLKYYKHSSFMRFKEAYNLVRKRSHGSIAQALDLGLELFSNYNLHPAVISACKNLDELDVYLSCMQYNELNDFHFFKTIFKINPLLKKSKV